MSSISKKRTVGLSVRLSASVQRALRKGRIGVPLAVANAPAAISAAYGDTDKGEHGYFAYYKRQLGPKRLTRNLVVEIGVGGYSSTAASGSLAVWRDYFPRSTIVGLDLYAKEVHWGKRVYFRQVDQNEPDQLSAVVEEFGRPDIVIDDGSHIGEHVWTSFQTLWPALRPGGIYVIEDVATSYYNTHGGTSPAPDTTSVGLARVLADAVQGNDPTFETYPERGTRERPEFDDVAELHVYPGIIFVQKAHS